jgi:acetyltransferase EpsM
VVREHCIINTHAVIEHDCLLEAYSSVAPAGVVGGGSTLHEGAFLGMNATLLQGRSIGSWSIVGAAALVVANIPETVVAYGSPASAKRKAGLTDTPFG